MRISDISVLEDVITLLISILPSTTKFPPIVALPIVVRSRAVLTSGPDNIIEVSPLLDWIISFVFNIPLTSMVGAVSNILPLSVSNLSSNVLTLLSLLEIISDIITLFFLKVMLGVVSTVLIEHVLDISTLLTSNSLTIIINK